LFSFPDVFFSRLTPPPHPRHSWIRNPEPWILFAVQPPVHNYVGFPDGLWYLFLFFSWIFLFGFKGYKSCRPQTPVFFPDGFFISLSEGSCAPHCHALLRFLEGIRSRKTQVLFSRFSNCSFFFSSRFPEESSYGFGRGHQSCELTTPF